MSDIKSLILEKIKKFIEWNKENWSSGGKNRWKVIALWVVILVVFSGGNNNESKNSRALNNAPESAQSFSRENSQNNISNISWYEVDRIYNISSNTSELQKDEEWKKLKGKKVQWSGFVSEVSNGLFGGLSLQIKMNPSTLTSDLIIDLKRSEKEKASKLSKNMYVTFVGILDEWGSLLPISLKDGELLN